MKLVFTMYQNKLDPQTTNTVTQLPNSPKSYQDRNSIENIPSTTLAIIMGMTIFGCVVRKLTNDQ